MSSTQPGWSDKLGGGDRKKKAWMCVSAREREGDACGNSCDGSRYEELACHWVSMMSPVWRGEQMGWARYRSSNKHLQIYTDSSTNNRIRPFLPKLGGAHTHTHTHTGKYYGNAQSLMHKHLFLFIWHTAPPTSLRCKAFPSLICPKSMQPLI